MRPGPGHLMVVAAAAALLCRGGQPDPRGIFIAPAANGAAHPAVRVQIELNRNGQATPVPATYRFRSGDRFRLLFELNQPSYVYVVNRSVEGNPDALGPMLGTRGINVVDQNVAAKPGAPRLQLLWPGRGGGARLAAGHPQTVPGGGQFFEFDQNPGLEKLALLVSPYPIDPGRLFTGLGGSTTPAGSGAGSRQDTNADVLSQLDDLKSLDGNTATDPGNSRGICVGDCSQYSAPKNPAQPFVLTVDLLHAR
jgi:hypothetical protein